MKKKLRQLIIHLKEAGKIILINSHDLAFVEEICTNFLILNNGKVCFNEPNIGVNLEEIYLEKMKLTYFPALLWPVVLLLCLS